MKAYSIVPVYVGADVTGWLIDAIEDGGSPQTLPCNYATKAEAEAAVTELQRQDDQATKA